MMNDDLISVREGKILLCSGCEFRFLKIWHFLQKQPERDDAEEVNLK
jgi:hypothetical protein